MEGVFLGDIAVAVQAYICILKIRSLPGPNRQILFIFSQFSEAIIKQGQFLAARAIRVDALAGEYDTTSYLFLFFVHRYERSKSITGVSGCHKKGPRLMRSFIKGFPSLCSVMCIQA